MYSLRIPERTNRAVTYMADIYNGSYLLPRLGAILWPEALRERRTFSMYTWQMLMKIVMSDMAMKVLHVTNTTHG